MALPEFLMKPNLRVDFDDGLGQRNVRDFYRVEVELKAVDGVVLPWPCLVERDAYLPALRLLCQSGRFSA